MTNTIAKRQNGNSYVSIENVVDNMLNNSIRKFLDGNFWGNEQELTKGTVPVNIRETEQNYQMDVIAPGCSKQEFTIAVQDSILTISFTPRQENDQQAEKNGWVRNEYVPFAFSRSFTLNDTVDINNIEATYTDGILHLVLGKNEKAKNLSRSIEVK